MHFLKVDEIGSARRSEARRNLLRRDQVLGGAWVRQRCGSAASHAAPACDHADPNGGDACGYGSVLPGAARHSRCAPPTLVRAAGADMLRSRVGYGAEWQAEVKKCRVPFLQRGGVDLRDRSARDLEDGSFFDTLVSLVRR